MQSYHVTFNQLAQKLTNDKNKQSKKNIIEMRSGTKKCLVDLKKSFSTFLSLRLRAFI